MAGLVVVLFAVPDLLVFDFYILTSKFFFVYYVWPGIPLLYYIFKICFIALRRPLGTLTCDHVIHPSISARRGSVVIARRGITF